VAPTANVATAARVWLIVTWHGPVPAHAPVQPRKVRLTLTTVPSGNDDRYPHGALS
jgi:hypothetical protein